MAREADELRDAGVRVRVFGDLTRLSPAAARAVQHVVDDTMHGTKMSVNLFISYGGRDELVRAARAVAEDVR